MTVEFSRHRSFERNRDDCSIVDHQTGPAPVLFHYSCCLIPNLFWSRGTVIRSLSTQLPESGYFFAIPATLCAAFLQHTRCTSPPVQRVVRPRAKARFLRDSRT